MGVICLKEQKKREERKIIHLRLKSGSQIHVKYLGYTENEKLFWMVPLVLHSRKE